MRIAKPITSRIFKTLSSKPGLRANTDSQELNPFALIPKDGSNSCPLLKYHLLKEGYPVEEETLDGTADENNDR